MYFYKLLLSLLFILSTQSDLLIAQSSYPELVAPESVGLSGDSLARMDAYFHQLVDEERLAGIQTAVMRHGKLVHFDSYGYANREDEIPIDEQTIFRIFSMTKPIVSVALMQLYEQGRFQLHDPLSKYIPTFEQMNVLQDSILVPAEHPIKVIDLLRHSSGFSYGRSQNPLLDQYYAEANLYSSTNNTEFVERLSQLPLQFEPGTDWQYGLSTNICGHLIEVISGQSLADYLKENIFTPLQMQDTYFEVPADRADHFTVGYGWDEENGLFISEAQKDNRYTREVSLFNGGGGLVSTSLDYLKFCQMMLDGGTIDGRRILKKETIALMFEDHLQELRQYQERFRLPYGEYGFGLGFAIRGTNESALDKVYGWGGAVGTYFKIDIENDLIYLLMIQLSPYRQLGLRQSLQDFVVAAIID